MQRAIFGLARHTGAVATMVVATAPFTTTDGLAGDHVTAILEDKGGNLWFATSHGVSRYNGQSFTPFTTADGLAGDYVTAIPEDKVGHLWFGTNGGGVCRL